MSKKKPKPVTTGSTIFVQACARMMSAAWIRRQIDETSTASLLDISGVAYAMRHTVASYCQIWCTEGWSCDGPAVLGDLDTVVELDALDDLAELAEAA